MNNNCCEGCYKYCYCYSCSKWLECRKRLEKDEKKKCFNCSDEKCPINIAKEM